MGLTSAHITFLLSEISFSKEIGNFNAPPLHCINNSRRHFYFPLHTSFENMSIANCPAEESIKPCSRCAFANHLNLSPINQFTDTVKQGCKAISLSLVGATESWCVASESWCVASESWCVASESWSGASESWNGASESWNGASEPWSGASESWSGASESWSGASERPETINQEEFW